ncbi:hypothetical protein BDW71DRAFT_208117 [Aspergillus fruticulosus]
MENTGLRDIAIECQKALANLVIVARSDDCPVQTTLRPRDLQQLRERYDQWAGNLGALQPSSSALSLEHRLRDSPMVRGIVFETLLDLHVSVQAATEIAEGKRPNRRANPLQVDFDEYDISSSESDTSSVASLANTAPMTGPITEIEELVSAIELGMDSLFRVSIFIRKFSPKDKRQRSSQTKPFDNRADVMYVKDRYPALERKNEGLAERLGEANARRRQYFKYRRDHNERLSNVHLEGAINSSLTPGARPGAGGKEPRTIGSVLTAHTTPSLFATSEATAFMPDATADSDLQALLSPEPAMSAISFATSIGEAGDEELPFPAPPEGYREGSSLLCPYCLTVVQVKRGSTFFTTLNHISAHSQRVAWICISRNTLGLNMSCLFIEVNTIALSVPSHLTPRSNWTNISVDMICPQ